MENSTLFFFETLPNPKTLWKHIFYLNLVYQVGICTYRGLQGENLAGVISNLNFIIGLRNFYFLPANISFKLLTLMPNMKLFLCPTCCWLFFCYMVSTLTLFFYILCKRNFSFSSASYWWCLFFPILLKCLQINSLISKKNGLLYF